MHFQHCRQIETFFLPTLMKETEELHLCAIPYRIETHVRYVLYFTYNRLTSREVNRSELVQALRNPRKDCSALQGPCEREDGG